MSVKWSNRICKTVLASIGSTVKVMLLHGYTPNPDHNFVSDIVASEISTTGYTGGFAGSGRKALTNVAFSQDDTNDWGKFDADDVSWTTIGVVSGYATSHLALWIPGTSDADSLVIGVYDLVVSLNTGNLTVQFDANGLATLSG